MAVCTQCSHGRVSYEEDGRIVCDVCYHCLGTSIIPDEIARQDELDHLSMSLASLLVREDQEAVSSDPEGEDWQLRAAENMMSEREYTLDCIYAKSSKVMEELGKLSPWMQDLFIKMADVYVTERPVSKRDDAITLRPPSVPNFPAMGNVPMIDDDILF